MLPVARTEFDTLDEYSCPLNFWSISPPPGLEREVGYRALPKTQPGGLELRLSLENGCAKLSYAASDGVVHKELSPFGSATPTCNPGSAGHPELCNRPCVYLARGGGCSLGAACRHCHLNHASPVKLDKKQRLLLQQLAPEELTSVIVPHIRDRVKTAGLLPQASELLHLLECAVPADPVPADVSSRDARKLDKVLSRVSLLALIRYLPNDLLVSVNKEVDRLRSQMAPLAQASSAYSAPVFVL
mmetsp:Transcript_73037/g.171266  ORF Transcript_73037/g.171266 Transcript_73037/m.171266 type:complete len:244 (+) Transcript_73037:76-807(+)